VWDGLGDIFRNDIDRLYLNVELSAENPEQSPSLLGFSALAKHNKITFITGMVIRIK
jgi:hypothetical protein